MRRGRGEREKKKRRQKKVVSQTEGKVQPSLVYFPLWLGFVCLCVCLFVCLRGGCGVLLWFLASWRRERDKDITERDREWMEDRQTDIHTDECKGNKKKNKGYINIHKAENEIVNDVE